MTISNQRATELQYGVLINAFDHFNAALFESRLVQPLITLNNKKGSRGFFHAEHFVARDKNQIGNRFAHELSLNPEDFATRTDVQICSTLVHEMVHLEQFLAGCAPRKAYHDKDFAQRMERVGLICSDSGQPGGKKTGQKMTHYIQEGGRFEIAATAWCAANPLPFNALAQSAKPKKKKALKTKYTCGACDANVWGAPELNIQCTDCDMPMLCASA